MWPIRVQLQNVSLKEGLCHVQDTMKALDRIDLSKLTVITCQILTISSQIRGFLLSHNNTNVESAWESYIWDSFDI